MKKHRSLISTLLIVTMLVSSVIVGNIYADDEEKYFESFDFSELAEANPQIPESDYDIVAFVELSYPAIRLSELDKLEKDERRAIVSDYYKGKNESLAPEVEIGYVSCSYVAPYIEIDYDSVTEYAAERDILIDYAENTDIGAVRVGLAPRNIVDEEGINTVNSNDEYTLEEVYRDVGITDRNTYNGEGIKVGILEAAHPNSTINFPTNNITTYGVSSTDKHTTAVMSLVGGTYGIDPKVSFYCAATNYEPNPPQGTYNVSFIDCLNWLLITNSVDIVNMSAGIITFEDFRIQNGIYVCERSSHTATHYTNLCAYVDYAIATTGCLIIKSAGNYGNINVTNLRDYVTKPAMAINLLTVGAVTEDNVIWNRSSFKEFEEKIHKPELVAPGASIIIPNLSEPQSGTSFATPIVTGIAIKLMQEFPKLKTNPNLLKGALMAGCVKCANQTEIFAEKTGYGRINYQNSRRYLSEQRYSTDYIYAYMKAGYVVYHEKISLPAGTAQTLKFNRLVLGGDTCTGYTGFDQSSGCTVIEPKMTEYTITVTDDTNSIIKFSEWNDDIKQISLSNTSTRTKSYDITIKTAERTYGIEESITLMHGGDHIHSYDKFTPSTGQLHNGTCVCGDVIYEMHTFNSSDVCTKCNMPNGFLSN